MGTIHRLESPNLSPKPLYMGVELHAGFSFFKKKTGGASNLTPEAVKTKGLGFRGKCLKT